MAGNLAGRSLNQGVSMRERTVWLMECPIMWGISVTERVVYGLMKCPIVGGGEAREQVVYGSWTVALCVIAGIRNNRH